MRPLSILPASRPWAKHEVDHPLDVGRSLDIDRELINTAPVHRIVAGVVDGNDDKAAIRQGLGRVTMTKEGTAPAMGEDHQRQLLARNRAILYDGHDERAKLHFACWLSARIPDPSLQRWKWPISRNLDQLETGGMHQ